MNKPSTEHIGAVILFVAGLLERLDGNSISAAILISSAWVVLALRGIASRTGDRKE